MTKVIFFRRPVFSWALYDWANSAYTTVVITVFFPFFLKAYWSPDTDAAITTYRLGMAGGVASLIVALLAPVLGAIADRGGARKKFLMIFALLGVVMGGGLYFVQMGAWPVAIALYIMASIGFSGANVFYDSLLMDVTPEDKLDSVSAFGFSLGYLGGGVMYALVLWLVARPEVFGLSDHNAAVRLGFALVALWWAVFSIPLFLFVRERGTGQGEPLTLAIRHGLLQLVHTFAEIRALRAVLLFLAAYWLYIDGVHTVVRMAVDFGLSVGLEIKDLGLAILITQLVGFPATLAFGWLGGRLGAKTGIFLGLAVYVGVVVAGAFLDSARGFYTMAVVIGLVQGGVQSLSRSFYARLIPRDKAGEFFGFYNMLGKFAAVIGPFLYGWVALVTGSPRAGIFSIVVLFVLGAGLLSLVNQEKGQAIVR